MADLLTGALAKAVYAGFKGRLLKGQIRQKTYAMSGGLDQYGDPLAADDVTLTACQGFVENYSDHYRANAGIPAEDVKVNIFAQSIPGITPRKDDHATFGGIWYCFRNVETDPATALWSCQAYVVPEPA